MEVEAGFPISPNMDPASINQTQIQLSFTRLIVQPLFETLFDLFPRSASLMELVIDNLRQWGAVDIPVIFTRHRRATEEKSRIKKHTPLIVPTPKRASEGGRRLSFAAGTVEIPEAIQKLLTKSGKPSRNSLRNAAHLEDGISIGKLDIEEEAEDDEEYYESPLSTTAPELYKRPPTS
jgi:3'5'-cyclic nucleotide phosphodiesterase